MSWRLVWMLPLAACASFTDASGDHALQFSGSPSCVEVDLGAQAFPDTLTIEGWVRGDQDLSYTDHPLMVWTGGFALFEDADGIGHFADGNARSGASYPDGWLDGTLHHVAGTWDGTTATIFVDGERVGFAPAILGEAPDDRLTIGCAPGSGRYHEGLIDEVRLSDSVRYDESFEVVAEPFEVDDATVGLWHFDEGEDEFTLDASGGEDGVLTAVEWVEFSITTPVGDDQTAG